MVVPLALSHDRSLRLLAQHRLVAEEDSPQAIPAASPPNGRNDAVMYEVTAAAHKAIAAFLDAVNTAMADTGIELDPSYGGLTFDGQMVGNLAWKEGAVIVRYSE